MRLTTSVLCLCFALCLASAQAKAGVELVYARPDTKNVFGETVSRVFGKDSFGKSYALVIGIGDYNGRDLPTLSAPALDAQRVHEFLKDEAGFDHIITLTDERATKGRIEELMESHFPKLVKDNDRFVFYFSGHGLTRPVGEFKRGYLALKDAVAKDGWHLMLDMQRVKQWTENLSNARHVLFILDACFSGLVAFEPKSEFQEKTIQRLMQPGHHILTAGTEGEQSFIVAQQSLFTQAFLSAARGEGISPSDGIVSLSEIMVQINKSLDRKRAELRDRIKMTPRMYYSRVFNNGGEFFFLPKNAAPSKPNTSVSSVAGPVAKSEPESKQSPAIQAGAAGRAESLERPTQPQQRAAPDDKSPLRERDSSGTTKPAQIATARPPTVTAPQNQPIRPQSNGSRAAIQGSNSTLDKIRARGRVICGVGNNIPGFSFQTPQGKWAGLDVDICRATAVAILGDGDKVTYVPTTTQQRFTSLQAGEVDFLARATAWTLTRDTALGFDFPAISYYDGQGFLVSKRLDVKSAKELNGATVCVPAGTMHELNLAEYFRARRMQFKPVLLEDPTELANAFFSGRCDVLTSDVTFLYGIRAQNARIPEDYVVLPEVISKEPLGPLVLHRDHKFADVVRWSLYAMLEAEELGITSKNIDKHLTSDQPRIKLFLGGTGSAGYTLGKMLGVDDKWAYNIIKQVGNYGESFERNLGKSSPLKLERGLNSLWSEGGLLYWPPFR